MLDGYGMFIATFLAVMLAGLLGYLCGASAYSKGTSKRFIYLDRRVSELDIKISVLKHEWELDRMWVEKAKKDIENSKKQEVANR